MSFSSLASLEVALAEVCQIALTCAHQAQHQRFQSALSSVPAIVQDPQRLLQLPLQHQFQRLRPLQRLRLLQPQLGSVPTMMQGLDTVKTTVATARTQGVVLVSCAKDRLGIQVTTVQLILLAKIKTWPSHVWIGLSAAMR